MTNAEATECARLWRENRDESAIAMLVAAYRPLVHNTAAKLRARHRAHFARSAWLGLDDMIAMGNQAVVTAAETFSDDRGCKFSTWLHRVVPHRIHRAYVNTSGQMRVGVETVSMDETVGSIMGTQDDCRDRHDVVADCAENPQQAYMRREFKDCVETVLRQMRPIEHFAVAGYYYGQMSDAQTAAIVGVTPQCMHMARSRAIGMLRSKMGDMSRWGFG